MAEEKNLRGCVRIRAEVPAIADAIVTIRLEHVPCADAAASILAAAVIQHVSHKPGEITRVPFAIAIPTNIKTQHVSVFGHVDVDRDGELSSGDLVTTQTYPLDHYSDTLELDVECIK